MNKMKNSNPPASIHSPPGASHAVARHRAFSIVGAGAGVVLFLAIALLPSLVYGGVASVQLASGVFGMSGAPTTGMSVFIVLGMVVAVTAAGSLFATVGAVAGASFSSLIRVPQVQR